MDKCALITGGSKGIGLACAGAFLDSGYRVINLSRNPCPLNEVSNIAVDMLEEDWHRKHLELLLAAVGEPDQLSLVHNAATLRKDSADSLSAEALREVFELNVVAPLTLTQALRPRMQDGSSVLFIASTLGHKAVANSCSYVTSKHALIGLMRATCQDFVGTGIHTAAICPGFTDTAMLRSHIGTDPAVEASIASNVAFGRLIRPDEIAAVVSFCAANAVVNGSVIDANLGQIER